VPINPEAVGVTSDPVERSWDSKDALLYAIGVGAGWPDPLQDLQFTTENTKDVEQQVLPTFPVIIGAGGVGALRSIGPFNPAMLVHGEQGVRIHSPIPVSGTVRVSGKVTGIYDKGSGAVVVIDADGVDAASGAPMFTTTTSLFIRGEGGWGGDRGPGSDRNVAPERAPDHIVVMTTKPDQALLYRLSGDRNPLHADPSFAARGGFDRPILHGLCTYGFTARALMRELCGNDPGRFRSMEGRFSKPVYPGDTLTVAMWVEGNQAVFRTSVDDTTVFDGGLFTFA
jgi:acyl dehydratase